MVPTDDRRAEGQRLLSRFGYTMSLDELLDTPFLLIGTVEQMAEQPRRHRERYGFSYLTVHQPYQDQFAPVIARLSAGPG